MQCLELMLMLRPEARAQEATAVQPVSSLQEVATANSLVGTGKTPFDLKVSFAINDMQGAALEKGTAEVLWGGPGRRLVTVSAPSFGTIHGRQYAALPNDTARRSAELAFELLDALQDG